MLAALLPSAAGAGASPGDGKLAIVLVHGAFADGSSWNGVVERLKHDGFPAVAVANPLRFVRGDAAQVPSSSLRWWRHYGPRRGARKLVILACNPVTQAQSDVACAGRL